MGIKILTKLGKRTDEHSKNFSKEQENINRHQSKMKNSMSSIKIKRNISKNKQQTQWYREMNKPERYNNGNNAIRTAQRNIN